ncbi:MAG: hypothetical protein QM780_14215 [Hyphomicrobium sp.]|uniref:hypothetical protein n=1 Tax=Hyphomicrobium sp. TaxID=82 RepID=UPI0039E443A7
MKYHGPPSHGKIRTSPPRTDHGGALILALLAAAAFCGWYLVQLGRTADTDPLPVVHKPIMPPDTTDVSSELPGHTHYSVVAPGGDGAKKP